jgi:ATP-dependent Clp protease ATP-binding subunit ClpC
METGRFSAEMPTILRGAREAALRLGQDYIGTEHLLIGLLDENGKGAALLGFLVDIDNVRKRVDAMVSPRPGVPLETSENLPLTRQAEAVIRTATSEAVRFGNGEVGSAHLLLALMQGGHLGAQILQSLAISHEQIETLLNQENAKGE